MAFPEHFVNKTAPFKFMGVDMKLRLSHALFSSNRVDDGTMLLLKSLAQRGAVPETGRVLDSGCGAGPLAIALKKRFPALEVEARDRLALACAFTRENARLNGVELAVDPGLLMEGARGAYGLVLSNLPAKAGGPVLADALARAGALAGPTGLAAVVIVAPLAEFASQTLLARGAEVLWREDTRDYRVLHYRLPAASGDGAVPVAEPGAAAGGAAALGIGAAIGGLPDCYRRSIHEWRGPGGDLRQHCAWGLPNFDGLDYRHELALELAAKAAWRGPVLLWEPVQGHLASALAQLSGSAPALAGNDTLALRAAAANLAAQGFGAAAAFPCASLADLAALPESGFGGLAFNLHAEPDIPWVDDCLAAALRLAKPGAPVLVSGSSTDLARFCAARRGLRSLADKKHHGWRAVLFARMED